MAVVQWGSLGIQAGAPCRVFVSYSHEDGDAGQSLYDTLLRLLNTQAMRDRGWQQDQIFYDVQRLKAIDFWRSEIETALEQCEILIFLVSRASLRKQGYCMSMELPRALLRAQRPALLVTVHLESVEKWAEQIIEWNGPGQSRVLGDSRAIPPGEGQGTRPKALNTWNPPSEGWSALERELADILKPPSRPVAAQAAWMAVPSPHDFRSHRSRGAGLLPYYCDQQKLAADYRDIVRDWRDQSGWALVVLYRGLYQDHLSQLGERMRDECLCDELPTPLEARTGLVWPESVGKDGQIRLACIVQLFKALQLKSPPGDEQAAAAELARALRGRPGTPHLHGYLMASDSGASLRAFMDFLELAAEHAGPSGAGLVIDLHLEVSCAHGSGAMPHLMDSAAPPGRRAWLRELDPPAVLTWAHVEKWHRDFGEGHDICPDALRDAYRQHVEPSARSPLDWLRPWRKPVRPELRMRDFAKLVEPLMSRKP